MKKKSAVKKKSDVKKTDVKKKKTAKGAKPAKKKRAPAKSLEAFYEHPLFKAGRLAKAKNENPCLWFLLCDKPATTTLPHPILGDVPTCARCAAKVAGIESRA